MKKNTKIEIVGMTAISGITTIAILLISGAVTNFFQKMSSIPGLFIPPSYEDVANLFFDIAILIGTTILILYSVSKLLSIFKEDEE